MDRRQNVPFREWHPAAKVFGVAFGAVLTVVTGAVVVLLGRGAYHLFLWLWHHI